LIEVKNLTKRYGQLIAVNDISFTVNKGEIVGFLGPNGAGKTTTMNMLTGFISATTGDININEINILDEPEKAKKNIGYLPENPPVYGDMTVTEYLKFVCAIKGVKKSDSKEMIEGVMSRVKISDMNKRLIKNLSKGYRQRVGLAQAMVGNPNVLILDEPTVGLDPKQIIEMRDVVKNLAEKHTVILSSHILSEVSAVCDRVIIINKGNIVASDTPEKLSSSLTQGHRTQIRVKGSEKKVTEILETLEIVEDFNFVRSGEPGTSEVAVSGTENSDIREALFYAMAGAQLPIINMKAMDLTLEEIFLQLTNSEERVDINAGNIQEGN